MALKYEDLVMPRFCDEAGAAVIVKKVVVFRRMVEFNWIAPVVGKHACTLFAVHQVHACCDLIDHGFYPGEKDPDKATIEAARKGAFRPQYLTAA